MFAVTPDPLDELTIRHAVDDPSLGAILTFAGVARQDMGGRQVVHLSYEAYPELAVPVMQAIGAEIAAASPAGPITIIGSGTLSRLYGEALALAGHEVDTVDASGVTLAGLGAAYREIST